MVAMAKQQSKTITSRLVRWRIWVQAAFLFVWLDPLMLRLHTVCSPVFHCYSCPLALFACPIGVLANFSALHVFPFIAIGVFLRIPPGLNRQDSGTQVRTAVVDGAFPLRGAYRAGFGDTVLLRRGASAFHLSRLPGGGFGSGVPQRGKARNGWRARRLAQHVKDDHPRPHRRGHVRQMETVVFGSLPTRRNLRPLQSRLGLLPALRSQAL